MDRFDFEDYITAKFGKDDPNSCDQGRSNNKKEYIYQVNALHWVVKEIVHDEYINWLKAQVAGKNPDELEKFLKEFNRAEFAEVHEEQMKRLYEDQRRVREEREKILKDNGIKP